MHDKLVGVCQRCQVPADADHGIDLSVFSTAIRNRDVGIRTPNAKIHVFPRFGPNSSSLPLLGTASLTLVSRPAVAALPSSESPSIRAPWIVSAVSAFSSRTVWV